MATHQQQDEHVQGEQVRDEHILAGHMLTPEDSGSIVAVVKLSSFP